MKIELIFKTPDVTDQILKEEYDKAKSVIDKFVRYNESITVIFDTETETCRVKEKNG